MGARNVAAAFHRWAGRVPPLSMNILLYMAVVSKDNDERPWFTLGHAALAVHAMGRENPDETDLRAVRRAMTPLLDAGALTVDRKPAARATGKTTARYRLNLDSEATDWAPDEPPEEAPEDHGRRTVSDRDVGRKVAGRRTKSGQTQDGNRPTKEERGSRRSEEKEEMAALTPTSHPPRESPPPETPPKPAPASVVEIFPGAAQEARYRPRPPWTTRGADTVAEATANRARRRAALAAGQDPP